MIGRELLEAQDQLLSARELVEDALEIAIKNVPLNCRLIRALRLTCKSTKAAADATVKKFTISESQDSEAVQRSGLLNNIATLVLSFNVNGLNMENFDIPQRLSRARGLLNLAVDVCSKSLEILDIQMFASSETLLAFSRIIGSCKWESLKELKLQNWMSVPKVVSGIFSNPDAFPALKVFHCLGITVNDIDILYNAPFIGNLTKLSVLWKSGVYASNTAPAMIAAMRNLLQKATSLESLEVECNTFEFCDCEQLTSLKSLNLGIFVPGRASRQRGRVDFALARPLKKLEYLTIGDVPLTSPGLVCIFQAEDTVPVLKKLEFEYSKFDQHNLDGLRCIRRPHLEEIAVKTCAAGDLLISKLAQLLEADTHALPSLREFHVECGSQSTAACVRYAISKLLSCPSMEALETLIIKDAQIFDDGTGLLYDIANYCPNLKHLDLYYNLMDRPAVPVFAGYGHMGAWPKLEKLGGLMLELDEPDDNSMYPQQRHMPQVDVQATLRQFWPGLECF